MTSASGYRSWLDWPSVNQGSRLTANPTYLSLSTSSAIVPKPTGGDPNPHRHQATGRRVLVTCWCERTTVMVLLDQVMAGRTGTCGQRRCGP
jgi:hypothetical protein